MSKLTEAIQSKGMKTLNIERVRKGMAWFCRQYHSDPVSVTKKLGTMEYAKQIAMEHDGFLAGLYKHDLGYVMIHDPLYNCAHRDLIGRGFIAPTI